MTYPWVNYQVQQW